jgi:hypothetical protein
LEGLACTVNTDEEPLNVTAAATVPVDTAVLMNCKESGLMTSILLGTICRTEQVQ